MIRDEALTLLRQHIVQLSEFGVSSLAIFGSTARGTAGPDSDVDVLATFRRPPTLYEFMGLKFALEEWLGTSVDLVDRSALRDGWRELVERESVLVA